MTIKFRFLTGDMNWQKYGGQFISKKLNNGEFDYWLVLDVLNWHEHEQNPTQTYNVSLRSVSPSEAGSKNLESAYDCLGFDDEMKARAANDPLIQVEALSSYGVYATLWDASGNNLRQLLRQAHEQASIAIGLYGFYMDRQQNRIGNSGWDFQRGEIGLKQE